MKNIHLTITQEKAYLTVMNGRVRFDYTPIFGEPSIRMDAVDMHITINEEPKLDEWGINIDNNVVFKDKGFTSDEYGKLYCKKIIMTTDQQLIRAGVQEISMEVLEWYAKNPTHDFVKIESEVKFYDKHGFCVSLICQEGDYEKLMYYIELPSEKTLSINNFVNVFKIPKKYFGSKEEQTDWKPSTIAHMEACGVDPNDLPYNPKGNSTREDRLAKALTKYVREKHTQEECIGFIDGFNENVTLEFNQTENTSQWCKVFDEMRASPYIDMKGMRDCDVTAIVSWLSSNYHFPITTNNPYR